MVDFRRIIGRIDKGYIAIIDKTSPEPEKAEIAEFSNATKNVLGLGAWYERYPLIKPCSWHDYPDDPRPQKTHVFVLVLDDNIIGYLAVRWHYHISQNGVTLDARGEPMNFWGVEGICVLPEYQRRGLGTLLLRQGLKYLKTNIREIAWDPPFTAASEALLRS